MDTWIKLRSNVFEDPAVIGIAIALGIDEVYVVGKLAKLWAWADAHLADGNAPSVTRDWVDRYTSCEGFAQAMIDMGWLEDAGKGVAFPNFERHMSESAKKRSQTQKRVQKTRSVKRSERNECNAPSVTDALPEKRREEKSNSVCVGSARARPEHIDGWGDAPLPEEYSTPEVRERLSLWAGHVRAIKGTFSAVGHVAALMTLHGSGTAPTAADLIEIIDDCMARDCWTLRDGRGKSREPPSRKRSKYETEPVDGRVF